MSTSPNSSTNETASVVTDTTDSAHPTTSQLPQDSNDTLPQGLLGMPAMRWLLVAVLLCWGACAVLWAKLGTWQAQSAQQLTSAVEQANQAKLQAKQAQDMALDSAAKLALAQTRLAEVQQQRGQLDEFMQGLSRSRDENIAADMEVSLRFAMQQAQLTGSVEPLVTSLQNSVQRLNRASQPRWVAVQRAASKDLDQIRASSYADIPSLLTKLDDLVVQVDDLPLTNSVGVAGSSASGSTQTARAATKASRAPVAPQFPTAQWWYALWQETQSQLLDLVRVSRIDQPEAALLAPEQAYFVRENLKLRLLNARLSLLSRQTETARADLAVAAGMLQRYFDTSSRKGQQVRDALQQLQAQAKAQQLPRVDNTLAALAAVTAGR